MTLYSKRNTRLIVIKEAYTVMKKYQYSIYKRETGSAGGKAKNDAFDIMQSIGFVPTYVPSDVRAMRILQQYVSIRRMKKNIALVVQYPAVSERLMKKLLQKLPFVACSVALIHDLPSIQGMGTALETEFTHLSGFQYLIVHNAQMKQFVLEHGYRGQVIELGLFDYLHDLRRTVKGSNHDGKICIAGNLDKSGFIRSLGNVNQCGFHLYGINHTIDVSSISNAEYKGLLPSDEIVYQLEGDYGLVWDGDSIDACDGIHGQYLRYNNPHKLSLYIAAAKPVITWKKAAIAQFVERENIGFTVDSLLELNRMDLGKDYEVKKANVLKIKERVATGYYLKHALKEIFEHEKNESYL